ncbi:effector-associated constant component EACC1 [Kribbella kalugense]|uniref:Uncharacterized protein n=1 Tax=Kribbella kalugense TaxID=2512221 RepID=A0A4V3G823_9ACTN|nr:hypothetical protein [Kribbella kalugense]TDW21254.1 hypothetical protein EV650_0071 [Kribbella kalugense]
MGVWVDVVLLEDDPEIADRGIRQLRRELRAYELEMRAVEVTDPEGSKGDATAFNAVAIALGGAGGTVPYLISVLRDWIGRRSTSQRVQLTIGADSIEVDAASAEEQQQLIEAFLRKHEAS